VTALLDFKYELEREIIEVEKRIEKLKGYKILYKKFGETSAPFDEFDINDFDFEINYSIGILTSLTNALQKIENKKTV
jgi:hypothetical protein